LAGELPLEKRMASKLDQAIARVAIVIAEQGRSEMIASAAQAASTIKAKDLAKMIDRWHPFITSNAAGVPQHSDQWDSFWFEAVAEILCQKKQEGVPILLTFWERDDCTYHQPVLIRLLRLAGEGIETDEILNRVKARFSTLHYVKAQNSVEEALRWIGQERKVLAYLQSMADIEVPNSDGETIGIFINRSLGHQAILEARKTEAPQTPVVEVEESSVTPTIVGATEVADKFARAVIRKKWPEILPLLTLTFQSQTTEISLGKEFGWKQLSERLRQDYLAMTGLSEDMVAKLDPPKRFEIFEVEDRDPPAGHDPKQPYQWIEVDFYPDEDSEFDVCYNCLLAIIDDEGAKITAYKIEDAMS
jgi:hypothetical protein